MNFTRINGEMINIDLVRDIKPDGDKLKISFDAEHIITMVFSNNYAPSLLCEELYRDIRAGKLRSEYNG